MTDLELTQLLANYHKECDAAETLREKGDVQLKYARLIKKELTEYASQQRTEGIKEGFLAARRWDITADAPNRYLYFTAAQYLNSKK